MDFDRVALVTGAARGIGKATVDELCRRGYAVAALDLGSATPLLPGVDYPLAGRNDLDAVAAAHPGQVIAIECDVRDPEIVAWAVSETVASFGRIDAVVAAAGVMVGGQPQWELPAAHLQTLFDTNVLGVWNAAAATVPVMLAGPDPAGCRFVAVASAAGERGLFHLAGYTASKHAVIGIVRGLAADLVGTGVTAVAVSPGSTRTAMLEATAKLYEATPDELAAHQTIGRQLEPEEIAAVIGLCCSAEGAALNGSVVRADGGFSG